MSGDLPARRARRLVAAAAVVAAACGSPVKGPVDATAGAGSIQNGKLAFVAGGIGHGINMVDEDGSGWTEITEPPGQEFDSFPAWSPDGRRIAFRREYQPALFVANADGTGLTPVAERYSVEPPVWSPKGTRIAFVGYVGGEHATYVVGADGSNLQMVTDRGGSPSWSPDGKRIALTGSDGIFTVNADGSEPMRLTSGEGFDESPVWSPDGRWVAFLGVRGGDKELYVVGPDGTEERRLTDFATNDLGGYSPSWSPDGSTIALEVYEDGNWNVYLVGVDDGRTVRLTPEPGDENSPVWSPDGKWIAYMGSLSSEANTAGTFDVHIVRPDGTDRTWLTEGAGAAPGGLSWQPVIGF